MNKHNIWQLHYRNFSLNNRFFSHLRKKLKRRFVYRFCFTSWLENWTTTIKKNSVRIWNAAFVIKCPFVKENKSPSALLKPLWVEGFCKSEIIAGHIRLFEIYKPYFPVFPLESLSFSISCHLSLSTSPLSFSLSPFLSILISTHIYIYMNGKIHN